MAWPSQFDHSNVLSGANAREIATRSVTMQMASWAVLRRGPLMQCDVVGGFVGLAAAGSATETGGRKHVRRGNWPFVWFVYL